MTKSNEIPLADELTDSALLAGVKSGESDAATTLYSRYARELHRLVASRTSATLSPRIDAEDIVQSVFRTFFRRASSDQYQVPPGEDLWKLFLVIALNKIRSKAAHHLAAKRDVRQTVCAGEETNLLENQQTDPTEGMILRMVIDEAISQLPPSAGEMIRLRIEGEEVNDIAQKTGRSKRSVERVLQHFREHLKRLLDDIP